MRWPFSRKPAILSVEDEAKRSFAIPIPEGADPAWFERVPTAKKRGRRRTSEEVAEDRAEFMRAVLAKNRAMVEFDRKRAQKIGCVEFIWRTSGDSDVCEACASLANRRFRYDAPPAVGMPGTHQCSDDEVCRCYVEAVIE